MLKENEQGIHHYYTPNETKIAQRLTYNVCDDIRVKKSGVYIRRPLFYL